MKIKPSQYLHETDANYTRFYESISISLYLPPHIRASYSCIQQPNVEKSIGIGTLKFQKRRRTKSVLCITLQNTF